MGAGPRLSAAQHLLQAAVVRDRRTKDVLLDVLRFASRHALFHLARWQMQLLRGHKSSGFAAIHRLC